MHGVAALMMCLGQNEALQQVASVPMYALLNAPWLRLDSRDACRSKAFHSVKAYEDSGKKVFKKMADASSSG